MDSWANLIGAQLNDGNCWVQLNDGNSWVQINDGNSWAQMLEIIEHN